MILTVMMALAFLFVLIAAIMTVINLALYRPARSAEPGNSVLVSACIPARNEEANLRACVESLLAGAHKAIEVLVYNDQSTDATGDIAAGLAARDQRVRLVPTEALPDRWNGKQWGCWKMAGAARGAWLLFTDADVRFEPDCVARSLSEAQRTGAALVSTFPRQITGSLGEALLVPLIHFLLLSYLPIPRMRTSLDPATSAGCGQFLLVRRDAYDACGGHAGFKASMHDGVMLPRAVRRAGFKTDLFDGTDVVSCRMYRGFGMTWRGFAKNAFEGLGSVWLLAFFTLVHIVGHVLPAVYLIACAATGQWPEAPSALAGAALGVAVAQRLWLAARFRQPPVSAVLHPVGIALMLAVQWYSLWLAKAGRRAWRGRVQSA